MTTQDYLAELARLRDRAERAAKKLADAQAAERAASAARETAAAALDSVADDPNAANRARADIEQARASLVAARAALEEAEAVALHAARAVATHEAQARAILQAGVAEFRQHANAELAKVREDWNAAAAMLLAVAGKAAALHNEAAGDFRYHDNRTVTPEVLTLLGDSIANCLDALIVPALGSRGVFPSDRLCDGDKARRAAPADAYPDLAQARQELAALARVVGDLAKRPAAAAE